MITINSGWRRWIRYTGARNAHPEWRNVVGMQFDVGEFKDITSQMIREHQMSLSPLGFSLQSWAFVSNDIVAGDTVEWHDRIFDGETVKDVVQQGFVLSLADEKVVVTHKDVNGALARAAIEIIKVRKVHS